MTNSDRLQEIRERARSIEAIEPLDCEEDRVYLLQLVTDQQKKIDHYLATIQALSCDPGSAFGAPGIPD